MDLERFLSQISTKEIFPNGQKKIMNTTVIVIGLGGTGSVTSELLARMGVGKLVLVDDDKVELSNLNRQSMYNEGDIGDLKVDAAKRHLVSINGSIDIEVVPEKLTSKNGESLLKKADLIMDGTDNYDARGLINRLSIRLNIPWIFVAVEGTSGYVKSIIPRVSACLTCMHYPEVGKAIPCTVLGVLPSAVHGVASLATSIAIKTILHKERGDLYYFDAWKPSIEEISIERDAACKTCGD